MKIGATYVPDEGSDEARILLVGEAPGEDEERQRRPFIGRSGQFLERYLGRCGVQRNEVYLANLCHYRPAGNKFPLLLGSSQLEDGLGELGETIQRVNPNVIVALGNWPMYYLTGSTGTKGGPGTGIFSWRGSVVPAVSDHVPGIEGKKTVITFHPAFVVRPEGFNFHPVFHFDLQKAVENATTPDILYPQYESFIDPPNVWELVEEMSQSEWLAVDIETFGDSLACVGFADSAQRGLCITYENRNGGFTPAQYLLESSAKKIFQFGCFDINYLHRYYDIETKNYQYDTYIAAANLFPEFKRGLDFLASIYTDFPFYKEERKTWKQTGSLTTLWEYNIKDCIATYVIAMKQMQELDRLYSKHRRAA